jgi:hypothetical protein
MLTVTVGIASYPRDGRFDTLEDFVRVADRRLYDGKRSGRNVVVWSDPPVDPQTTASSGHAAGVTSAPPWLARAR